MTVVRLSVSPDFNTKEAADLWISNNSGYLSSRFPNRPVTSALDKQTGKYAVFGSFPKPEVPESEEVYNPQPTPTTVSRPNETKVNSEIKKHRELFGKPITHSHNGNKLSITKLTYWSIGHELRLRRFLNMRKANPEVFGTMGKYTLALLDSVNAYLCCEKRFYRATYEHLLREIQYGKRTGIWGVSHYGYKHINKDNPK